MAATTWNFACHEAKDWPENPAGRGRTSGIFYNFSNSLSGSFTAIFSVLIRSGWTVQDGADQRIFALGANGKSQNEIMFVNSGTSTQQIRFWVRNINSGAQVYQVYLGDEDGVNWMQDDKWYQIAVSCSDSEGGVFAVNGSTSPKYTLTVDNLGTTAMDIASAERICLFGPYAYYPTGDFLELINFGNVHPSVIVGPAAYSDQFIDLSDSAVLGRIYDENGDFRNPGEDGSLWFGDTYGANTPEYYFTNGTPRVQNGTDTATNWKVGGGSNYTGRWGGPGGLRKQYES